MKQLSLTLVLGARPQIIKSAPLIHSASKDRQIDLSVIHTGQHYDYEMAKVFFDELDLPDPAANLNVGSGTHAQQTARVMTRLEKILLKRKPDIVIVPGDTNSTIAGALTAAKLHVPVAHIESGARSYDMRMPEEVNRRLTDHCSTVLFTPTDTCTRNLLKEGISRDKIHQCGDTMYDAILQQLPKAEKTEILQQLGLERKRYALLTTHRPENVDNPKNLKNIVDAITKLAPLTIVFPIHPRTLKQLKKNHLYDKIQKHKHLRLTKPIGYHETLKLVKNARLLLTDSGGMQKESFWLKTPCVTMRENTEWPEIIQLGANHLTGANPKRITGAAREIIENEAKINTRFEKLPNPFGDGEASRRIIETLKDSLLRK